MLAPEPLLLYLFLRDSGCRLGEALKATRADIGEIDGQPSVAVLVHSNKGGDQRISFISRELALMLAPREGVLFPWGRRRYQRAFERAGFKAHDLRHQFITETLDNGADLISVMQMVGHVRADTTRRYWHFTEERLHTLARSVAMHLPRGRRKAHLFVDIREGRLDP